MPVPSDFDGTILGIAAEPLVEPLVLSLRWIGVRCC